MAVILNDDTVAYELDRRYRAVDFRFRPGQRLRGGSLLRYLDLYLHVRDGVPRTRQPLVRAPQETHFAFYRSNLAS